MKSSPETASGERGRLFRRYFLLIGGGISVVLLLALVVETSLSYRETLDGVGRVQTAEVRSAAARVDQYLGLVQATLSESAAIPWTSPPFSEADGRSELHRLLKLMPALDSLQLFDAAGKGRLAVSRRELDRPEELSFDEPALLDRAREKGAAMGHVKFRSGVEAVASIAVRGANRDSGILVGELNLRNVSEIVTRVRIGSSGRAFMVDGDDRIVAHPDGSRTLLPPSPTAREQVSRLRAELARTGEISRPVESTSGDGSAVLSTAVALPKWGWIVVAEEPVEAALAPVRLTVYRLLLLMAAGIAMALALSAFLARRLARPILSLRSAAEKLARGDLDSRTDVRTGDEIEALARDFNAMAGQLQDYTTGLERKVEEKTAKLQEAMRARELFLAAASHDLRQPLYALSILNDTLAMKPLRDVERQIVAKQQQTIAILRTLFDNLLDMSRLEAGEVRPVLRDVSLRELFNPIAVEFEVLAHAKGLGWASDLPDAWVRTDPELARRLAANLLSNAVRYTATGSVRFSAGADSSEVTLVVEDTGIGIPKEHQARVFEEFVQLDNPGRQRERGVGLGLSIVKKIDALLGTRLKLDSEPGKGTRVGFTLPAVSIPEARPVTFPAGADSRDLAGIRLWVVEDERAIREALAAQFDALGVDCAFALTHAEIEALRKADGQWPDAVLLDDMLGQQEGGLELALWLKEHLAPERIILVTGNVRPQRLEAIRAAGFRILRKPIAAVVLAQSLSEAIFPATSQAGARE